MTTDDAQLAELEARFHDDGIAYLLVQFVDIHGAAKVKLVPVTACRSAVEAGAGFAGGPSGEWGRGLIPMICWPAPMLQPTLRCPTSRAWPDSPPTCMSTTNPTPTALA